MSGDATIEPTPEAARRFAEDCPGYQTSIPIVDESIYDHPKYYDLVFGADVAAEKRFIVQSAKHYVTRKSPTFFEPACGTGRLVAAIAADGHPISGLDLNERAIEFCNARLKRRGLPASCFTADMSDFKLPRRVDIAFNTINSFRHLLSETAARNHLVCMGEAVRPGGIYLLGIHLTPTEATPSEGESWSARRGHLSVNTMMWTTSRDTRRRIERFGLYFDVHRPAGSFRIVDELVLRSYTDKQWERLVASSECWSIEATYDFGYDLDEPTEVDATSEDVVYVLRRR